MDQENLNISEDGKVIRKEIPFTGVRRTIANNFFAAVKDSACTSSFIHEDVTRLVEYREKLKSQGHKFSYTELYVKLVACALEKSPMLNAALVGKRIHQYTTKNISVAIAYNGLLYTPVVRNVEQKGLLEIQKDLSALIERVEQGTLELEDMMGATFTISNMGNSPVCATTQILSPPQVAVLGIGAMKKGVEVDEADQIVIRQMGYFAITVEHSVVMGSDAVAFYNALIELLQDPESWLTL